MNLKKIISRKKPSKILLVHPPYQRLRGMLASELPVGLLYVSSVLRKNGFEAKVLNLEEQAPGEELKLGYVNAFKSFHNYIENRENHDHPAWKEYRDFINTYRPDIIGFSVMTPSYALALSMARVAKKNDNPFIVFGGAHPTLCPEEVASDPCVDAVIAGEGEMAFLELVRNFQKTPRKFIHKVPSVVYAENGKIINNPLQPLVKDLDTLPYPDYESLVRPEPSALGDRFGFVISRGCPYRCGFCVDHLLWRKRTRYRTHSAVVDEIKFLSEHYNLGTFFFQQDSFLNRRELAKSISSGIIKLGLDTPWWCAARIDQIEEDLLKILKEAGLHSLILGIESGSQHILGSMNKKITLSQIEHSVNLIKKHGIRACAFFMIGLPDETEDDIQKTVAFMKRLPLDFVSLSVFTPFPGSALFKRCAELGLINKDTDWSKLDFQSPENHFCLAINKERFSEIVEEVSQLVDDLNARHQQ